MSVPSKIWALRMPGGPTKIVRSSKPISESVAKDRYLSSFKFRSSEIHSDPDIVWPLVRAIDEQQMHSEYSAFVEKSSKTGAPRALVEV